MTSAKATPLTMLTTWIATVGPNNMGGTDNKMLTADKTMVSQTPHLLSAQSP